MSDRASRDGAGRPAPNEALLRLALDSAGMGVWRVDLQKGTVTVDDRFKELFGLDREDGYEFRIADVDRLIHPADYPAVEEARRRAREGQRFFAEFRVLLPDGGERWLAGTGEMEPGEGGVPVIGIGVNYDITEQVRSREAARKTEQRLDFALDAGGAVGTWEWDVADDVIRADARFAALFGVSAAEAAAGLPIAEYTKAIHPDDRDRVQAVVRRAVEARGDYQCEYRTVQPDGTERWLLARGRCITDETGTPVGFPGVAVDITDRKRAEQTLRESEAREARHREFLESLFGQAQACIAVIQGPDLRFVMVNPAYQALRPDLPMPGRTYGEVFPAAAEAGAETLLRRVLDTGEPEIASGYYAPIPGKPDAAWDHQIVRMPLGDAGPALLVITWDATEHKRAERALRQSQARLQAAQETARIGIFEWDIPNDQIQWDDRLRRIWGVGQDDPIDLSRFFDGVHPDDRPAVQARIDRALDPRGDGVFEVEYRVVNRRNGSVRWVGASGHVSFRDGTPKQMLGAAIDVTARRQAEEALRESEGRLRSVLQQMPVGTTLAALPSGEIVFYNTMAEETLGHPLLPTADYTRYAQYGALHADGSAYRPEDYPSARVVLYGEVVDREPMIYRRGDGRLTELEVSAAPIFDSAGRPVLAVCTFDDVSERSRAEEELRRAHALLAGIAQGTEDLIAAQDGDFRYLFFNDAYRQEFRRFWGRDIELGDSMLEAMAPWPEEQRKARELWSRALTGETFRIAMEFGPTQAETQIYDLLFSPVRDGRGRQIGAAHISRNVTEQEQLQLALRESGRRLRLALDAAEMGVWELAEDADTAAIDAGMTRLFGLPAETGSMPIDWFYMATHPEDRDAVVEQLRKAWQGHGDFFAEFRICLEGRERWVVGKGRVIAEKRKRRMLGVTYDVTPIKQAEIDVAESEARFREMADNAPVMIWVTDTTGYCTFLSRSWYEFTGQTPTVGLGFGWVEAVHPEERDYAKTTFLQASAKGEPFRLEYRLRRADGEYRWTIDAAAPRIGRDGRFFGYIGSVIDIDERYRAELHRKLLIDELNHRVKNTLAIVQGMAQQTFKGDPLSREARKAFEGRLAALATAHNLLTRESWEKASLADLTADALHCCGQHRHRIAAAGPKVVLRPKQAVTIAMALHELCTNAVKYGALSNETGKIAVEWGVTRSGAPRLWLTWRETGGPPVEPPQRRGFGTRMIEQALAYELGGDVRLNFDPRGVVCEIDTRLEEENGR